MMTGKSLLDKFLSKSNFITAYNRVASKKASGGIDGASIEAFGRHLDKNIKKLQEQIRNRTYIPQPVQSIYIPKFNEENEWRELGLPTVADKVVQASLLQVVEPLAEKIFLDTSYGYRPGKGHYKAIRRVEHNLSCGHKRWVVHRDIDNFFDTLNHDQLLARFSNLVKEEPIIVELVALWCRMGLVEKNGRWRNIEAGVRQGHVISPLLANLYLHPLDEFVTQFNIGWVRYADDFLIQCTHKEEAEYVDKQVRDFLDDELSLRVNKDETATHHIEEGFTFLGVYFCGEKRAIAQRKMDKIQKKIAWLFSEKNRSAPEEIIHHLTDTIYGWKRYYGFFNPVEQFGHIDKLIEESFVVFAANRIKQGKWGSKIPDGVYFPILVKEGDPSAGLKKMRSLWKQTIEMSKPMQLKKIKEAVDARVSRRRQKHQREHAENGELIVTAPGCFIGKRSERIIVRMKQKIVAEVPVIKLSGLIVSSRGVALSGDVVELCMRKDIYIHLVDGIGRITAVVSPPGGIAGDISLLQVKERDSGKGLSLARMFVWGKVKNQLALLKYYYKYPVNRENGFGKEFGERGLRMKHLIDKIRNLNFNNDPEIFRQRLMGLEGAFAIYYWLIIKHLFNNGITFETRKRQGANDLVNSALNYGYGILYGRVLNAVIRAGLNPMAGFLHCYQSGKPVLIYDIVEEFRPVVVDRSVFTLLRRGEKLEQEDDYMLTSESKKKIALAVIKRLSSEVLYHGRKATLENVIKEQAINIKKHLFETRRYKPFLSRW